MPNSFRHFQTVGIIGFLRLDFGFEASKVAGSRSNDLHLIRNRFVRPW